MIIPPEMQKLFDARVEVPGPITPTSAAKPVPKVGDEPQFTPTQEAIKKRPLASSFQKTGGQMPSRNQDVEAALTRMMDLIDADQGQGPRQDVPAKGFYLNLLS